VFAQTLVLIALIACNAKQDDASWTAGDLVQRQQDPFVSELPTTPEFTTKTFFRAKASLIVCPNQLVNLICTCLCTRASFVFAKAEQWQNEVRKFSNTVKHNPLDCLNNFLLAMQDSPLKLIACMTKVHHEKMTYRDVAEADIVLVSREFISGWYKIHTQCFKHQGVGCTYQESTTLTSKATRN